MTLVNIRITSISLLSLMSGYSSSNVLFWYPATEVIKVKKKKLRIRRTFQDSVIWNCFLSFFFSNERNNLWSIAQTSVVAVSVTFQSSFLKSSRSFASTGKEYIIEGKQFCVHGYTLFQLHFPENFPPAT